jgi:hypothetical protein
LTTLIIISTIVAPSRAKVLSNPPSKQPPSFTPGPPGFGFFPADTDGSGGGADQEGEEWVKSF